MREHMTGEIPVIFLALMLIAFASFALLSIGVPPYQGLQVYMYNSVCIAASWIALSVAIAAPGFWRDRPESPIRYLLFDAFGPDHAKRTVTGLMTVLAIIAFSSSFNMVKSAIPLFTPYTWDPALIAADRALHFGYDPWRLLHPLLGYPLVSSALSIAYHFWFLLIYAGTIWFAIYEKDPALRRRYLIAYLLIWSVIGMALAVGLASVGPVFVRPLFGIDTFDEQMAYLRAADAQWPIWTLQVQQELLAWHHSGSHGFGRGISAMPSMHVALAFLFFLAMRHISSAAATFFGVFFVLILLGSVHLGYHYALDGYVSILITGLIWKLAAVRGTALPLRARTARKAAASKL